jgi:hypothetical protein
MGKEAGLVKLVAFISTLIRDNCIAYRAIEVRQMRHLRQEFGTKFRRMGLSVFESQRIHTTAVVSSLPVRPLSALMKAGGDSEYFDGWNGTKG